MDNINNDILFDYLVDLNNAPYQPDVDRERINGTNSYTCISDKPPP